MKFTEEHKNLVDKLNSFDGNACLYEYSQALLELIHKNEFIKLGAEPNASNSEHFIYFDEVKIPYSFTIKQALDTLTK